MGRLARHDQPISASGRLSALGLLALPTGAPGEVFSGCWLNEEGMNERVAFLWQLMNKQYAIVLISVKKIKLGNGGKLMDLMDYFR